MEILTAMILIDLPLPILWITMHDGLMNLQLFSTPPSYINFESKSTIPTEVNPLAPIPAPFVLRFLADVQAFSHWENFCESQLYKNLFCDITKTIQMTSQKQVFMTSQKPFI